MSDDFMRMLLAEWSRHRAEGARHGIDDRHDWGNAPEWAHAEATEWERMDSAWRLLIGARLAADAIQEYENEEADQ